MTVKVKGQSVGITLSSTYSCTQHSGPSRHCSKTLIHPSYGQGCPARMLPARAGQCARRTLQRSSLPSLIFRHSPGKWCFS